jgi:L-alanine-DL-glutamate epimerase-like enolase superfamily enzyme
LTVRIASIAARTIRWSIASQGAARGRTARAAVVIEVRTERGAIGLGEAAPLPGMSPDTLEDAERAVATFARRAPFELDACEAAYALAAAASNPTGGSPAARFAIETALLDALARERQISLAELLRAPADHVLTAASAPHVGAISTPMTTPPHVGARPALNRGEPPGRLPALSANLPATATSAHVGAIPRSQRGGSESLSPGRVPLAAVVDDPEGARRAFAAGIRCFKIKLAAGDDPERVFAIARAAPGATLRIDANRSWPSTEVSARLAALAALPIDYVEEPCPDAHLRLPERLPCKLALDESLAALAPDDLRAALRHPALAAVVLKPTLLGGLSAVLAIAELARRAGVAAIASHGLEGPVGTAACAELALVLGGDHPAGLAAHPALTGWLIDVPQLAPDHVHAATAPGLGFVDLDLARVVKARGAGILEKGADP